ncbi:uncharacterized protein LDX57_012421 [Aspergillus melleus]|uniref:uncharacterized protein n=1 Tax=Aspergillus melleus TaxID=138277 RepID=UPI001E8CD498|nr:uncharacterized protein LDX57_012421 [Aspergillus melleus]KAH8434786.1 hypothetical protein LDX57_012421 [Aspergillus melleus]
MSAAQPENMTPRQAASAEIDPPGRSTDDERSDVGDSEQEKSDDVSTYAPINAVPSASDARMQRLHSTSSRPVERSWSLNDGYSCHTADEEAGEKVPDEAQGENADESSAFVVGWDENDSMNPRNFNTFRRWIIVIICSLGSLCV